MAKGAREKGGGSSKRPRKVMPAEGEVVSEIPSGAQPRRTKGTAGTEAAGGRFGCFVHFVLALRRRGEVESQVTGRRWIVAAADVSELDLTGGARIFF
jgi:hypothetical protein